MALGISSDKYNPAVNETYSITITPDPGAGIFHHHITLYESSDGGETWNAVQTWQTMGSSPPRTKDFSKSAAGSFKYQAKDYDVSNNVLYQSDIITVTVGGTQTSLSLACSPNPVSHHPPSEGVCTATATLTAGGSPLSGKTIHFYVRKDTPTGATLYQTSATTNEDGEASVQLTPSLWQSSDWDPYIVGKFQGDETYAASSDDEQVIWYDIVGATLNLYCPSEVASGTQFQLIAQLFIAELYSPHNQLVELYRDGVKVSEARTVLQSGSSTNATANFYQTLYPGTYSFQAKLKSYPGGLSPLQSSIRNVTATGTASLSLTATPGAAQVIYDWSKYEGANFHHYRLKIGTTSEGSDIANLTFSDVNTTSYLKTGLANGVTYYARVYAEKEDNTILAQSDEITATPQATAYSEIAGTATSQKIALTRAVSGEIISAATWNTDEEKIEGFTGRVFLGSATIPANIKEVKVNLPSGVGLPIGFKIIGVLESPAPTAISLEEITSTSFKLHLAAALPYSATFHYIIWGVS